MFSDIKEQTNKNKRHVTYVAVMATFPEVMVSHIWKW